MPFLPQVEVVVALQEDGDGARLGPPQRHSREKGRGQARGNDGRGNRDTRRGKGAGRGFGDDGGVYWSKVGLYLRTYTATTWE